MRKRKGKRCPMACVLAGAVIVTLAAAGCGSGDGKMEGGAGGTAAWNGEEDGEGTAGGTGEAAGQGGQEADADTGDGENAGGSSQGTGLADESAADGHVDFEALQKENPDVFAWLYVPGTGIDAPVLQSPISDDYYKSHGQDGKEGDEGALYTEMPNMMNMCDFNTIIHGKDDKDGDLFAGLHKFEDPDFFEKNEEFYIYLPDNVLTYEVFAAYYDDGSDILRRFDFTTYAGCEAHLEQIYAAREMGKQLRDGWNDLTPYHFLVTLDGSVREDGKQYVVIGALIGDAAGVIDRMILD